MATLQTKTPFFVDAQNSPVALFSQIMDALPLSVQSKIVHLRDEHDRLQWMTGDLYNEIYAHVRANRVEATRIDVANYLLHCLGLEEERGFSSVLQDAATSGFYPVEIRGKYSVLPFSHFRFAASFGVDAQLVLDEAMNFFEQYGRPPSIRWLKNLYLAMSLETSAAANEPGSALPPGSAAALIGSFGPGPAYEIKVPVQSVEKVRFFVTGLKGAITGLPGGRGDLIARIITLCDQALENL